MRLASEPPGSKVALRKLVIKSTHNADPENQSAMFSKPALNASSMSYQAKPCLEYAQTPLVHELRRPRPLDTHVEPLF